MDKNKIEQAKGFELLLCHEGLELVIQFFLAIEEKSLFVTIIDNRTGNYVASTGFDFSTCSLIKDMIFNLDIVVKGNLRKGGDVVGEIEISLDEIVLGLEEFDIRMGLGVEKNHIDALDRLLTQAIGLEVKPK